MGRKLDTEIFINRRTKIIVICKKHKKVKKYLELKNTDKPWNDYGYKCIYLFKKNWKFFLNKIEI